MTATIRAFRNYGEPQTLRDSDLIHRKGIRSVDPTLEELVEVRRLLIKEKARADALADLLKQVSLELIYAPESALNKKLMDLIKKELK